LKYNINILESKYFFPFRWEERDKFENIEEYLNEDVYGIHLFETILGDVLINNKFWNNNRNNFSRNNLNPYDEIVVLTLEEYPENHKRIKNEFEKLFS
jgi:predicted negative regulator of RcsB-dependent stress response